VAPVALAPDSTTCRPPLDTVVAVARLNTYCVPLLTVALTAEPNTTS
jgi:hypothetical protein